MATTTQHQVLGTLIIIDEEAGPYLYQKIIPGSLDHTEMLANLLSLVWEQDFLLDKFNSYETLKHFLAYLSNCLIDDNGILIEGEFDTSMYIEEVTFFDLEAREFCDAGWTLEQKNAWTQEVFHQGTLINNLSKYLSL